MSNFSVLSQHDEQLLRLGMLAEKYFADDPNTCLHKCRFYHLWVFSLICNYTAY